MRAAARAFPNLTDSDWLHGGTPEKIERDDHPGPHAAQMPPMAAAVGTRRRRAERRQLRAEPVGQPARLGARRSSGKAKFTACAACHGIDGKGNQAIGAPNLTDKIWLHGWGEEAIIAMVNNGKTNEMPAQEGKLTAAQIHVLAAYVWGLSQQAGARQRADEDRWPCSSPPSARSSRSSPAGRRRRGSLYAAQKKIYPRAVQRLVRALALGAGVADAARVLRPAVAAVGRPPGGAVRPRRAALLHLRLRAVSAGLHLPHRPAGDLRVVAVPVHRRRRPAVVRLRLPADRLHRDLPVDRAPGRGRPQRAHAARRRAVVAATSWRASGCKHAGVDRASACGPASPSSATSRRSATLRRRGRCTPAHRALGDGSGSLFYGFATYGNAGFLREQVCKYMCPYARFQSAMFDRDTLIVSYDTARGEPRGSRSRKADPAALALGALHRLHACACRSARPASTSARACSTSASAAPPASTPATA